MKINNTLSSKLRAAVELMQDQPNAKGREVHRRTYLIQVLKLLGFTEPLNDVSQQRKTPDLRFYPSDVHVDGNSIPAPFVVETKDFGDLKKFDDLPFRQLLKYVHRNRTRIVAIAATDYQRWYYFEFDTAGPSLYELFALAKIASASEETWESAGGDQRAREVLEPFWRGPAAKFDTFTGKVSAASASVAQRVFNPSILNRSSPFIARPDSNGTRADVNEFAANLGKLMRPLVNAGIEVVKAAPPKSKVSNRFKLWATQRQSVSEDFETFLTKDRTVEEEKKLASLQEEFGWLASYSILNLVYFLKGLEEREIIPPTIATKTTQDDPVGLFPKIWTWLDERSGSFATDFIRLQKVYCDWLIGRLPKHQLEELIRHIANTNISSFGRSDLLGRLYELLMQNLDTESRKRLGQYYTPKPIAEVLWSLAWEQLKEQQVPPEEVTTIDPGCGSGMLLCRGAELLLKEMNLNKVRLGQGVRDLASRNVNGYEINPLSAAIARINLYYTYIDEIISRGGDPASLFIHKFPVSEIPVFNTDAYKILEPVTEDLFKHAEIEGEDIAAWKHEAAALHKTKQRADFVLVIGNPPYCGQDQAVADGRADHLKVWSNESCVRAPNSGIREALIHYLGLAHTLLSRNKRGMIAFVTSDTWLNNRDYEQARRFFFRRYDPAGIVFLGPNMFPDVRVATTLVLLKYRTEIRPASALKDIKVPVSRLSIEQSPDVRFVELNQHLSGEKRLAWRDVNLDEFSCVRFPDAADADVSGGTTAISNLFLTVSHACQSGADPFVTARDESALKSRMRKILGSDDPVEPDPEIPGKNTAKKLALLRKFRDEGKIKYKPNLVRKFAKFNGSRDRFAIPEDKVHFLYFEPDMLDRPRLQDKWNPHEEALRIGFNSFELPLRALVVETGEYLHRWQHMRFAALTRPTDTKVEGSKSVSNLSAIGQQVRDAFTSDLQFLYFISACINSDVIQTGFGSKAKSHEPPIPLVHSLSIQAKAAAIRLADTCRELAGIERLSAQWGTLEEARSGSRLEMLLRKIAKKHKFGFEKTNSFSQQCFEKLKALLNADAAVVYGVSVQKAIVQKKSAKK